MRIGVPEYVGAANPIYSTAIGIIGYVLSKKLDLLIENENLQVDIVEEKSKGKGANKFIVKLKGLLKGFSNEEVKK